MYEVEPFRSSSMYDGEQAVRGVGRLKRVGHCVYLGLVVRRMEWLKKDGQWFGQWAWEAYDRSAEWNERDKVNNRWLDMHNKKPSEHDVAESSARNVPQEVLLGMVHQIGPVSIAFSSICRICSSRISDSVGTHARGLNVPRVA